MTPMLLLILILVIALPIAWLASEFGANRPLRIALGIGALTCSLGVAYIVGRLSELNYNAWFGGASKDLIHTIVVQTEDGRAERVLKVLRRLDADYHPTYENRADYVELINEAVAEMNGVEEIAVGSRWDMFPFSKETWMGHWENDSGYWLVIDDLIGLTIQRSGDDMSEME